MVNLVIDIGNTFTKVALFNNRSIEQTFAYDDFSLDDARELFAKGNIDCSIISSVDREIKGLEEYLQSHSSYRRFHGGILSGIVNHYRTPQTLGLDRLAAVIGAVAVFPGKDTLVIDAGTCITYDFISRNKEYWGGSISPGLAMRFKAMNTFTERLPLIDLDDSFVDHFGDDTRRAMLSGAQNGALYEVMGFIGDYSSRSSQLQVVLCGGDAKFFDTRLKNSIFAPSVKTEPHLVLIGLNEVIHNYNND